MRFYKVLFGKTSNFFKENMNIKGMFSVDAVAELYIELYEIIYIF